MDRTGAADRHKALLKFVETVRRCEQENLTYFDERITNGFVEGTNNKIKLIKRRAFAAATLRTFATASFTSVAVCDPQNFPKSLYIPLLDFPNLTQVATY